MRLCTSFERGFRNALFMRQKPQFYCFTNKRLKGWRLVFGANYLQFGGGSRVISANSL